MADTDFQYDPAATTSSQPNRIYERELDGNLGWALEEGGLFFEEKSRVHQALRKITRRLDELEIPYVVVGAMGFYGHGYRRFTEDVDLLVTADGLKKIHDVLEGNGYRPPFTGSKNLRDTEFGVRIEFLVAGEFPGDGKPKPVAFPSPDAVQVIKAGIRFARLESIVELKLASGMTNPGRLKDLADVQEIIKVLGLPKSFTVMLDPFVKEKYVELWDAAQLDHGI